MSDAILTPNKFALIVENIVNDKKISYIDAILEYCKDNEIDPSNTRSMINKTIKEKMISETIFILFTYLFLIGAQLQLFNMNNPVYVCMQEVIR